MHTGQYISGAAHGVLILWVMFGGVFRADPPEMQVSEVSVISEAQFAALSQPQSVPDPVTEPAALPQPDVPDPVPDPPAPEVQPVPQPQPETPEPPVAEEQPQPVLPTPPADVTDNIPQPPAPDPVPEVVAPDVALRPVPRPAPRVAPEAVPEPDPQAETAPEVQEAAEPEAETNQTAETEQEATAPEAAATEIVTEAEEPARAPTSSLRPAARPNRPAPVAEAEAPTEPDPTAAAIAAALAEAQAPAATDGPSGPPLTAGETDGFRLAVQDCWVVDVGSQAANVTVTVAFDLDRSGRVVTSSLRMIGADGGDARATETAFQAARRAVLRCQDDGYDLPEEKYEQWKQVEMTFNPESMRIR